MVLWEPRLLSSGEHGDPQPTRECMVGWRDKPGGDMLGDVLSPSL